MYWMPFFKDWSRFEYIFFETSFDNQRYSTSEMEIIDPIFFLDTKKKLKSILLRENLSPPPLFEIPGEQGGIFTYHHVSSSDRGEQGLGYFYEGEYIGSQ